MPGAHLIGNLEALQEKVYPEVNRDKELDAICKQINEFS